MESENQNISNPQPAQPPFAAKKWHQHTGMMAILILAIVAVSLLLVLAFRSKYPAPAMRPLTSSSTLPTQTAPTPSQMASSTDEVQSYINSITANPPKAKVLDDKYGIFMDTSGDQINNLLNHYSIATRYQDDGVVGSGSYVGYHRLAAFKSSDDPSGGYTYFFATKDYQTFILDTGTYPPYGNPTSALSDPDTDFNKAKVVGMESVPGNFPTSIEDGNFVLVRNIVSWDAISSTSTPITSVAPGLSFYSQPIAFPTYGTPSGGPDYQNFLDVEKKYISGQTGIFVQDQFGLVYSYNFLSKEQSKRVLPGNNFDLNFYKSADINSTAQL